MSSTKAPSEPTSKTKKNQNRDRVTPHHTQKAKKYYPAEDESKPKKVYTSLGNEAILEAQLEPNCEGCNGYCVNANSNCIQNSALDAMHSTPPQDIKLTLSLHQVRKSIKPAKPRESLQPGAILILLAGRFRGKRVVLLKHLPQGVLLVTGPFKANGVPLRRVNARYVIATSSKVELKGIDGKTVEKVAEDGYFTREKKQDKSGEEAFFKQGEKPEVRVEKSGCVVGLDH